MINLFCFKNRTKPFPTRGPLVKYPVNKVNSYRKKSHLCWARKVKCDEQQFRATFVALIFQEEFKLLMHQRFFFFTILLQSSFIFFSFMQRFPYVCTLNALIVLALPFLELAQRVFTNLPLVYTRKKSSLETD